MGLAQELQARLQTLCSSGHIEIREPTGHLSGCSRFAFSSQD